MRRPLLPGARWSPDKVERFIKDRDELTGAAMTEKYGAPAWKIAFMLRGRGVTVPKRHPGTQRTD